ncbi:MAG: hypothetical protein JO353_00690 [Phycisphaerae bacterium]|nr:hypothetical protein [Phycisphaerae bacterium]
MRFGSLSIAVIGLAFAGGCATQHHAPEAANTQPTRDECDPPAVALAFDPPITIDQGELALDRESREPRAFVGYDEPTITYSYLRVDDRMDGTGRGRYDREAVAERIGVSTR